MKISEHEFYEKIKDWDFSKFDIKVENYTNWDLYDVLKKLTNKESKILDLGTGGGENLLENFPKVKEILGTDYSCEMIKTANENLRNSGRSNIKFKVMDNIKMETKDNYFDVVVARNTVTDPKQIYKTLKHGGYILIRGVDKMDCWELKRIFNKGQAYNDNNPISKIDYENVLDAGFQDVELIPIHQIEYYKDQNEFISFLLKTPILDEFSEEENDNKETYSREIDLDLLEKYLKRNTTPKGIRLIRRYYGIIGRK